MNEIEIKNRIKEVLNQKDETINSISKDSAIQVRLSRQINGKTALSYSTVDYILEYFPDLSTEWLLRGTGTPFADTKDSPENAPTEYQDEESVPVITVDLARKPNTDIVKYINTNSESVEYGNLNDQLPQYDLLFRAINNAMDPYISKGDIMALRKVPLKAVNEGEVYMLDTPNGVYVRRVYKEPGGYICKSSHPKYPHIHLKQEDLYNVFLVVIVVRFSLTPSAISLDDIEERDNRIASLEEEKNKLIDETIKYGSRIDKLLDLMDGMSKGDINPSIVGLIR